MNTRHSGYFSREFYGHLDGRLYNDRTTSLLSVDLRSLIHRHRCHGRMWRMIGCLLTQEYYPQSGHLGNKLSTRYRAIYQRKFGNY